MGTARIVIGGYCDKQMALRKGLIGPRETNLPRCEKKCDQCLAYIEIDTNGEKEHVRKDQQEWKKRQKEKSKK